MIKKYILFIFLLITYSSFSQKPDNTELEKMYFHAFDIEQTFPDSSLKIYEKVISITKNNPNNKYVAYTYVRLSYLMYSKESDLAKRLEVNLKAAKIFQTIQDTVNYIVQYQTISVILAQLGRNEESLYYSQEVLKYGKLTNNSNLIIIASCSIADCYCWKKRSDTAVFILENLKIHPPSNTSLSDLGAIYQNLGNSYFNLANDNGNLKNYNYAIVNTKKAIDIFSKLENKEFDIAYLYGLIGASNMALGNYVESETNYKFALNIFETNQMLVDLEPIYNEIIQLYIKKEDKNKAMYYLAKHDSISRAIFNNENIQSVSEMKIQFETEKKESENKLLQTENLLSVKTIKQQKIISIFIITSLLIVSILALFIFRGLKKQRKANRIISEQKLIVEKQKEIVDEKNIQLNQQNEEISTQRDEIEAQRDEIEVQRDLVTEQKEHIEEIHKDLTDSINYAERIQRSFLATKELLDDNLKEYFVFFQPKDVVSGDFYWAGKLNNGDFALVTADSTGHGVPGAIMSILNISSIEKAVEQGHCKSSEILNHTRNSIIERLKKDGSLEGGKDGMDASLICFDFANLKLTYSAANNPIWVVREKEIIELNPDKMPLGKHDKDMIPFTQHDFQLFKNDLIYTFTDGLPDQFGGPKDKKFMYKQFKEILLQNCQKPMLEQKNAIETAFNEWKGLSEQIDDVTVLGIRI